MNVLTVCGVAKQAMASVLEFGPMVAVGAERTTDGWRVRVQAVELHRIPEAHDLIGTYEVDLDDNGEVTGWRHSDTHRRDETSEYATP